MCSKCKRTSVDGTCRNPKADLFKKECAGVRGMDVNDCPYAVIDCKTCNEGCDKE